MALILPNFNLTCRVWRGGMTWNGPYPTAVPVGAPTLTVSCQLYIHPEITQGFWQPNQTAAANITGVSVQGPPIILRVPALTDIRAFPFTFGSAYTTDLIECPSGTRRLYAACWVQDIHKGFTNEYRAVGLAFVFFVPPYPMP